MCNVFYMRSKIYIFEKLGLLKTQKPAGEKKIKITDQQLLKIIHNRQHQTNILHVGHKNIR